MTVEAMTIEDAKKLGYKVLSEMIFRRVSELYPDQLITRRKGEGASTSYFSNEQLYLSGTGFRITKFHDKAVIYDQKGVDDYNEIRNCHMLCLILNYYDEQDSSTQD